MERVLLESSIFYVHGSSGWASVMVLPWEDPGCRMWIWDKIISHALGDMCIGKKGDHAIVSTNLHPPSVQFCTDTRNNTKCSCKGTQGSDAVGPA